MKYFSYILLFIFLFSGVFWVGNVVSAQPLVGTDNCDCTGIKCSKETKGSECEKMCCGTYGVNDVVSLAIKAANIVFGLVGSLVLLFFVYGGFLFLVSSGNREQVAKGKRVIIGSIVGLLIVFFSYTAVGFIFAQLKIPGGEEFYSVGWFTGGGFSTGGGF